MQKQTRLSLEITQSLNQTDRWRLPRPCKVKQGQPKSSKVTVRLHHPSAFAADLCQKERVSGRCLRSRERDLTRVGSRGILSGGLADLARRRKSSVNTGFGGGREGGRCNMKGGHGRGSKNEKLKRKRGGGGIINGERDPQTTINRQRQRREWKWEIST